MGTARRSHFWDRVQVHFLKFFVSGLQKRNVLVSMKLCGLWRLDRQLGRPFWAKPVLRRFSGPRIGSVGASSFVDDFAAKRRPISLLQPLGDCLKCFLLLRSLWVFRAGGRQWLYWILYCPLLAPLAPLDSYRSFQPRKNMNHDLFSQSRY